MNKFMEQGSGESIASAIGINFEAVLECIEPERSNYDERFVPRECIRETTRFNDLASLRHL
jgi:hypothetical protein